MDEPILSVDPDVNVQNNMILLNEMKSKSEILQISTMPLHPLDHQIGEAMAIANPPLHYIQNKDTKDLYHDLLARRVIRRMRRMVLQHNVRRVLYNVVGLGQDAADMLSRRVH